MKSAAVIYAAKSKIVRRIIVAGPGETFDPSHAGAGEAMVMCRLGMPGGFPDYDGAVEAVRVATGVTPPSGRCVVISGGRVVNVIKADPDLDRIDGATLIATETADVGWSWTVEGGFVPPLVGPASTEITLHNAVEVCE